MNDTVKNCVKLGCESLESRAMPAALVNGNIQITGTSGDDHVVVRDVKVHGQNMIRVDCNGHVQNFKASQVTGKIVFNGYAGDDYFDYTGYKCCYVDGGSGDDFLSGDKGSDYLCGGSGEDTLEGWGGNDTLKGGNGGDVLDGGYGNDCLYGQAGDDQMGGGHGNDKLYCGSGQDLAWGGDGSDKFWDINSDDAQYFQPIDTRFGTCGSAGVQDPDESENDWTMS